jgi:serine phosphatase RsbU (regulator of sigma subunit)
MFGTARLDRALAACGAEPAEIVEIVRKQVEAHTAGLPASDDRTLVVARVV